MSANDIPSRLRTTDAFHHIDMGFLNRRLALRALPAPLSDLYIERAEVGSDHLTQLRNDHLLVTMLEDACRELGVPSLLRGVIRQTPQINVSKH